MKFVDASELENIVWFLKYASNTEALSMSKIIKETKANKILSKLTHHIHQGYIPKSSPSLTPFRKIFDELTISDEGFNYAR